MAFSGVRCTCVGVIVAIGFIQVAAQFTLTAPRNYTVFTGDIRVSYSTGNESFPSSMVQLLTVPKNTIITTVGIPHGYPSGELTFICSVIDYAGEFRFRLIQYYGGPTLVETPIMYVSWPLVQMTLPPTHLALTKEVTLQFVIAYKLCDTAHSSSRFWLDVVFYGANDSVVSTGATGVSGASVSERQKTVIHRQELRDFTRMKDVVLSFPCDYFDQAGLYQVTFSSTNSPADRPIAVSNVMHVRWSSIYSLSARVDSIFPCGRFVQIYYTHPECSGDRDKIRMYKQLQIAESSAASPTNLYYVGEQRVPKSATYVTFTCDKFDESVPGYCFKYVTTASNRGAVHEQTIKCLLSSADAGPVVHGGWSAWSTWTVCSSSQACGEGKRSRYRACDNPLPAHGGRFCDGDTVQWQHCRVSCKETVTLEPPESYTPDPNCVCGCVITASRGKIVGTTDRCRGSSTWVIRAPDGYVVQLEFERFALDTNNRNTWVKVRDGDSQMNNLLLQQFGGQKPSKVRSSRNVLLIELMSPYDQSYYATKETFVALYKTVVANGTGLTSDGTGPSRGSWESTVTIVGVGLCFVIILATIAFACHYRISKRHKKTKKQQALLTPNGSMPNSPSHSHNLQSPSHSLHSQTGSNNVTFAPDVHDGKGARRDFVLAKGVSTQGGPLVSDGRSSRGAKARSPTGGRELPYNVDAARPGSASSHAQSSLYASPLQSPYASNAKDGDFVHDPKLLKAQPTDVDYRHHQRHSRRRSRSPPDDNSPHRRPASMRSRSPESHTGSSREARNQSFKKAVSKSKGKDGVPLADEEDLSPISPTQPTGRSLYSPAKTSANRSRGHSRGTAAEQIPLDSYNNKRFRDSGIEDTPIGLRSPDSDERRQVSPPETRPPVEGRDAGKRMQDPGRHNGSDPRYRSGAAQTPTPGTPDRKNANFVSGSDGRPDVKPLPLRHVQRPDGQSPENHHTDDPNANTPSSVDGLSPILQKSRLFPENSSQTPSVLSLATQDGYEYDDYIPELPGSYFTMDPHAYTLTWSSQPPWAQKRAPNSNSENSASTQNNESHA